MTTSRIVRGNKGRIFAYVVAVVVITGVIACYNNTLSQLDDARLNKEVCQRESDTLSNQLHMITDYKQRLEKSLKVEKAEHSQTKKELQTKLEEERAKNEKTASQVKLQLSSLQQSYQLLQTQYEDFKQKCSDNQQEQANEINQLQATLKEAQEELKKLKNDKENLKVFKDDLEEKIKNTHTDVAHWESEINRLTKENNELKRNQHAGNGALTEAKTFETLSAPSEKRDTESSTNFSQQVSVNNNDDDTYQIRDAANKPVAANVADQPPQNAAPAQSNNNEPNEAVLAMPNSGDARNSPPSKLPTKGSSKASLEGALPLKKSFTVTPETAAVRGGGDLRPFPYKRLPDGVVDVSKKGENNMDEIRESFPNRYRNKIIENERVNEEEAKKTEQAAAKVEEAEKDNGAHEELDFPMPGEEKLRKDYEHINNLGLVENLKDDVQERAADADQNEQLEQEDDEEDGNNEPAIRN